MFIRKVLAKKEYNQNLLSISVHKGDISFKAGQHFSLSIKDKFVNREYSVFSSEDSSIIEFLIRIVDGGVVSNQIKKLAIGDEIYIHGPFGKFLNFDKNKHKKLIMIATGSGIAPFRSLTLSNNISNFKLIHGVRKKEDIIENESFKNGDVTYCISDDENHNYFNGRLTKYLNECDDNIFSNENMYYICGNKDMIADVYKILIEDHKISSKNIDSETFF